MTRKDTASGDELERASTRRYRSPLRQAQAEQTQQQIVEAAYGALATVAADELSYAALAERLGISVRTVYRHFPERTALLEAVARHHVEVLTGPEGGLPRDLRGAADLLRRVHQMLEDQPHTYRLFFQLPIRSQGGVQRLVEVIWAEVLARVPARDRAAAAGLFEMFMSPYAYDVLHENWGLSAPETSRVCLVALDLIARALEEDPQALSADRPLAPRFDGRIDDHG